ncbi:glycosyltransferase [Rathayibacter soli]|uniref:glycosyltransferase n=1 Tax=Rathayibacter soli TaxID=3144168 RepID=UPI0027E4F09D|nr:glycosyltransferase [Glaciibacter superstes]
MAKLVATAERVVAPERVIAPERVVAPERVKTPERIITPAQRVVAPERVRPPASAPAAEPVIAIAHDYLTQRGGAERVVLAMLKAFPKAKIYTTLYDPDGTFPEFRDADIVVSPLNRIGALRRHHRRAFPLLAMASSRMQIPADIVLASSSGWAHGFRTSGRTIVYCHTPARWLYLTDQYLGDAKPLSLQRMVLRFLAPALTRWDHRAADRADRYLANASGVSERIRRIYGRHAPVVFPPQSVDTEAALEPVPDLTQFVDGGECFLVVSRLLPYKNVAQVVDAFRETSGRRLVIVGDGPMRDALLHDLPENVRLVCGVTDAQLRWLYMRSAALLAPSHEDLGLTVLEAAAWGKPTLALHAGGYLDTVVDGVTGCFFPAPTAEAVRHAVREFDPGAWDADAIRAHAALFSEEQFAAALTEQIREVLGRPAH